MKKYLFGLGAMIVGAGLMFVLMHGEASADKMAGRFVCTHNTYLLNALDEFDQPRDYGSPSNSVWFCKSEKIECGVTEGRGGISCVKTGLF
jgi:hypothetical protein